MIFFCKKMNGRTRSGFLSLTAGIKTTTTATTPIKQTQFLNFTSIFPFSQVFQQGSCHALYEAAMESVSYLWVHLTPVLSSLNIFRCWWIWKIMQHRLLTFVTCTVTDNVQTTLTWIDLILNERFSYEAVFLSINDARAILLISAVCVWCLCVFDWIMAEFVKKRGHGLDNQCQRSAPTSSKLTYSISMLKSCNWALYVHLQRT